MFVNIFVTWLLFELLQEMTAAHLAWDFVRFFACPAVVAFGVAEGEISPRK